MNKLSFAFWMVLTGILFTACNKRSDLPVLMEVKYNEWTQGPGMRATLTGEINDSRCALDVVCVWQGAAWGIMAAEIGNTVHNIPYEIKGLCEPNPDPCGNFVDTLGYQFQFLYLSPYPTEFDIPVDYVLSVKVEKN
ncbi:MAG: hypothetical protein IPI60_14995 [Saprospiraceae bacterium]|jgi:hypothetical protein|nr:hypothetical protein [Saprospiraceae bacterium]